MYLFILQSTCEGILTGTLMPSKQLYHYKSHPVIESKVTEGSSLVSAFNQAFTSVYITVTTQDHLEWVMIEFLVRVSWGLRTPLWPQRPVYYYIILVQLPCLQFRVNPDGTLLWPNTKAPDSINSVLVTSVLGISFFQIQVVFILFLLVLLNYFWGQTSSVSALEMQGLMDESGITWVTW